MKMFPHAVKQLAIFVFAQILLFSCSPDQDLIPDNVAETPDPVERNEDDEENQPQYESRTVEFSPINDAYLEDSKGFDQTIIRLQENSRTAYLMFDLSVIEGNITDVTFKMTVDGDDGDGELLVYNGISNDWSEENLNDSNAPNADIELGTVSNSFDIGATEYIQLSAADIINEKTTLILTHRAGNDLAIASKENSADIGPKLIVTYLAPVGSDEIVPEEEEEEQEDPVYGPLKAFPAAYGGGSMVTGGRGGTLVIVNTLDFDAPLVYDETHDVYEGGIKEAIRANIGPRYIVFSVSGVIDGGNTEIYKEFAQDISIMGQSAPEGGITLYRGWIDLPKSSNIIVRYMTVRSGVATGNPIADDFSSTPFKIGHRDIIMDHLSASWGGDKGLIASEWKDGFPMQNMTVQNCMITDSHTLGFTVDGANGGPGDWDVAGNISWHYNFLAGGNRTPNLGGFDGLGVIQNNVVQSNGTKLSTIVYGNPKVNHVGNYYYIHKDDIVPNRFQHTGPEYSATIYSKGNYYENLVGVELNGSMSENNEKIWISTDTDEQLDSSFFTETINPSTIPNEPPTLSALQTRSFVMNNSGANKYMDDEGRPQDYHSAYDQIAKDNFESGILTFRKFASDWSTPDVPNNTRPADYDTDKDGMSDAWEIRVFGNLSQGYNGDHDGDGYTNIEEFLNQVDL